MSYDTNRNWFYELHGRYIHLWQVIDGARVDTLGSFKIRVPAERIRPQLIYPDEDITDGLRVEYTSFTESEIFVFESLESATAKIGGTTISFNNSTGYISDSGSGLVTAGFVDPGSDTFKVRVIGSASNDGDHVCSNVTANNLSISPNTLTTEAAGESITVYQIPTTGVTADEAAHINVNRMLSLAVVDYVKAMQSELQGDVQGKEYYMKEFWKKVADDQSNKRKISMSFPISAYAVK